MGFLDLFRQHKRSLENPQVAISDREVLKFFGLEDVSATGRLVTVDTALGIPAIWAAVNFLSGMLAGLPLQVYRKKGDKRQKVTGGLTTILNEAVNDGMSSFDWRFYSFTQLFTVGRSLSFIERNKAGRITNIWPLNPANMTIKRKQGVKTYHYRDAGIRKVYEAREIIDLPFMLQADMLQHRSPILTNKDTIGLMLAMTAYGSKFFNNGGVPPFVIEGPFTSPGALQRASENLSESVVEASRLNKLALALPDGHKLNPIGSDPEKMQMEKMQRFMIEQVARIWSLPPTFLQDLTHGTFKNTEQSDLHMVKHTAKRWVEQIEQELNLKLFGRSTGKVYVEMNLDGLLRGDFKTRMDGFSKGINSAMFTPNEVRRLINLPDHDEGNELLIQGATVPIGQQPLTPTPETEPDDEESDDE